MATRKTTIVKKTKTGKLTKTVKTAEPAGLRLRVMGIDGKSTGTVSLPPATFGAKVNPQLTAQAVRVYLANQRAGQAKTKTRGEVEGSTRKIYKQKGTGRARHGAIRAPIFVGGGIVFGPIPRDYTLGMSKKLKRAALASALTGQLAAGNILVVEGLGDLVKTKQMAKALHAIGAKASTLLVVTGDTRAARNLENVDTIRVSDLHTYAVLSHDKVVLTKEAVKTL